jgi:flagellar motor protein MotB
MGKNDWQKALDNDDWTAASAPKRSGRGWRVTSMLLLTAFAAFAVAYYWPLYRAHSALNDHYRRLSKEAATQRQQLTDTVATLKAVAEERDKLAEHAQQDQKDESARKQRIDRLERSIEPTLKPFKGKGLALTREGDKIVVSLSSPALIGHGTADVTAFGKRALCAIAQSIKTGSLKVVVIGSGATAQPKGTFSFPLASARAGNAAEQLGEGCGLESSQIAVAIDQSLLPANQGVRLVIEAKS